MLETIKSNSDISNLFASGKRYSNKYVTFIATRIRDTFSESKDDIKHGPCGRVAFIAGKKYGNSVWRNSAKRRLREIYKSNKEFFVDFDVLLIAKSTIMKDSFLTVSETCQKTLMKLNNE